jgi:hypothetical protein
MAYGDLQYVTDTFLIERLWSEMQKDASLTKEAQLSLGSILDSIGSSVKNFFSSQVHGKDEGGVTRTIIDFLAPALFFRIHPLLGVAVTAAQILGFDLYSIFQKLSGSVKSSLEQGKKISPEELNSEAATLIPSFPDDPQPGIDTVQSQTDLLYFVREAECYGWLKAADGDFSRTWGKIPFTANKNDNFIIRMFGFLGKRRCANIVVGILVWFLKTILLSVGLLGVGAIAVSALGQTPGEAPKQMGNITPAVFKPQVPPSTGAGSKIYKINPGDLWLENLYGDTVEERVLQWTVQSYPDLNQYIDIISRTPSFRNTINKLSQNYKPGSQQISIPDPYKSRDDVLKDFISDVYSNIKR